MYLTDINECRLVQCYKDQTATTIVKFDGTFWSQIIRRLILLARRLDDLERDSVQQDELLVLQNFPVDFTSHDQTEQKKEDEQGQAQKIQDGRISNNQHLSKHIAHIADEVKFVNQE